MTWGRKTGGRQVEGNEWRFWAKVRIRPGCWGWTAHFDQKGYGKFGVRAHDAKYKITAAHDFAYEQLIGPIPDGKVLDHVVCDNPSCPNPFHVTPTTSRENTLRGRGPSAINARKTHCIRGHELNQENTIPPRPSEKRPGRHCKLCAKIVRNIRRESIA